MGFGIGVPKNAETDFFMGNSVQTAESFSANILIVDDHAAVRAGLRNLISTRAGWHICGEAADGEQAVSLALQLKPSVVVMDISMPGMDGLEATRRIHEHLPSAEILIVSQHDSDHVVSEAQRAGARGFVVKSHLSADLLPALEAALRHSSRISAPVSKAWQGETPGPKSTHKQTFVDPGPHDDLDLMSGGGEMGAQMRSHDWSRTVFGPVSAWPQSLRTALRICLDSRFPIVIWWGPELRLLYNDAWRPMLGATKETKALGAPGKEVWPDIWDTIGPMLESVIRTGQAIWETDQMLLFDRHGYLEESYWSHSYSAIRLASGEVGGVFGAVHEVTDRVLSTRRLKTLHEVADQVVQAQNEVDACTLAMQSIVRNPADCPYAMIFLCEDTKARLVATSFETDTRVPALIDLSREDKWAVGKTVRTGTAQVFAVDEPESMPGALFGDKCSKAISIPVLGSRREVIGVLTIGISPYHALDAAYQDFLESLAKNLTANVNRAQAYELERKLRFNAELLAAIVAGSDDAIISKNLDGTITSWNKSAERMFGYTPKEAIGRHITLIIPDDRREEETHILERLRRGERVDHFQTVRKRKDGTTFDISLTISPVRDATGRAIGASKVARDITAQRRAEQALRQSEERFRAIVETTPECVKVVASDGTLLHMNSPGLQMVGAPSAAAVIGKSTYDLIAPEDRDRFRAFNERVCAGEKGSLEFDVVGLDGTRRHLETHAAPLREPQGDLAQLAITRDVTRRKQSEELLLRQRERFELVSQAAHVGFWFCDLPFDKLIWDARVKEHFWLPPDAEVTIDTFYDRLHPDDRERTRRAIEYSNANDTPYDLEYRTVSLDGRIKWIRAVGRTFYDAAGRPERFDGLTVDVTDRKQAEERERQITAEAIAATAKFRAVFEQTTVFAGIMSKDGVMMDANKLCLEACGYRAEEVLGKPFWQTGWWQKFPESQDKIRTATPLAAQGIPFRETLPYSWADGTERLVDFALYPIFDHEGTVLFLHPTGVDITDLKHAEENSRRLAETLETEVRTRTLELENRNVEMSRQSELLRQFSQRLLQAQDEERRHIARELHDTAGQTLTVLGINLAQLMQKAGRAAPDLVNSVEMIQETVEQLHRDIRTTSYLLHPPLLDESGLSSALSWYIQGLAERGGIDIKFHVSEDLGRLPRDLELLIFRLVQECLTNIHRHSGSKTASIRIARHEDIVTVEVQDRGRGMSPEKLAEIQSRGSGVGIRGMRERLRQFDGNLQIDSSDRGTRILATIPLPGTSFQKC
jgi:PAS domain S-box-containing protein